MSESRYQNPDAQLGQIMLMLSELAPGCACLDTSCPTGDYVPHMATDGRNHPRPYGLKPDSWSIDDFAKRRQDAQNLMAKGE